MLPKYKNAADVIPEIAHTNYHKQYQQLSTIISSYASKLHLEQKKLEPLIENAQFNAFMKSSPGIVCVVDFKTQGYIYMSDNSMEIIGYPKEDFLRLGITKSITIFSNDQIKVIIDHIFPLLFSFFEKHALAGDVEDIRISYNTKIIHSNGYEGWYLHQMKVLHTDENNLPHFGIKMITDISDIKKDEGIDFIVAKKNELGRFETIYSTTFIVGEKKYTISDRESEILQLMGNGLNSKEISDTLFISEHTVNNHRKNILRKLDAKNTIEVIRKAIAHGLI